MSWSDLLYWAYWWWSIWPSCFTLSQGVYTGTRIWWSTSSLSFLPFATLFTSSFDSRRGSRSGRGNISSWRPSTPSNYKNSSMIKWAAPTNSSLMKKKWSRSLSVSSRPRRISECNSKLRKSKKSWHVCIRRQRRQPKQKSKRWGKKGGKWIRRSMMKV